ncbi:hypothetical protein RM780_16935 [Streptomyces sp. DSM 44917]|uniref:Aromatic ring-opening dioxygenase LigA n=1 Tax=Streptomyces boetiae TaxID=3075541 RepID=A0ABU2LBF0_9ACTN|nr:hypothetical protein [Streptomyces sp. DSM 44917]MDT0308632.1 hypothetical protein [Streptomyces sp. DSM 44917]
MRVRGFVAGCGLVVAGLLLLVLGAATIAVGTGAPGLETRTFGRISCSSVTTRSGVVWHCSGESPEQARANDEAERQAEYDALRAHRESMGPPHRRQHTDLRFVPHDGQRDPGRVTASRLPVNGWWIAHSGNVVATGVLLTLAGGGAAGWGGYRLRGARRMAGRRPPTAEGAGAA